MSDLVVGSERTAAAEMIADVVSRGLGRPALTCSFQIEDMVVLHMLRRHVPDIPVIFLETGYHFPETYAYRDHMTKLWKLNLVNATAEQTVQQQEELLGILYQSEPSRCCHLRKVEPLMKALEPYEVWFTGLRREQSSTRRNLQLVEETQLASGKSVSKVNPLAFWDTKQVWRYISDHSIEYLSLYDKGYTSIGCATCTSIPSEGADPRSGRWGGTKLECGIHTFSAKT